MKRYILFFAAAAACVASCDRVMDLTPPEKGPVDYDMVEFSLYESGTYDYYLDNPSYDYSILIGKSHAEKAATARFDVRDVSDFGEDYVALPDANWELSSASVEFKESDTVHEVDLSFTDLTSLDPGKKYVLGLELSSDEISVAEDRKTLTFYIYQEQGGDGNPIIITTPDGLAGIGSRLKAGQTTYFRLGADIDMSGVDWTPVNTTQQTQIDFDGCGYTVSNLSMTAAVNGDLGFFSFLRGRFANVNFENVTLKGDNVKAGVVAGRAGEAACPAVIENIKVSGAKITIGETTEYHTGGICSILEGNDSRVSRCSVTGAEIDAYWSAAGICGYVAVGAKVSECHFSGNILTGSRAGGIVGLMKFGTVENCYSSGRLDSGETRFIQGNPGPNGGIVAYTIPPGAADRPALISRCYSECYQTTRNQCGGILGYVEPAAQLTRIEHCIAWNECVKSTQAPRSGRVCGFFKQAIGIDCWADPDMKIEITGNPPITEDEDIDSPATKDRYNGKTATGTLVETARDVAGFDPAIWDFSGERPVLKWEIE